MAVTAAIVVIQEVMVGGLNHLIRRLGSIIKASKGGINNGPGSDPSVVTDLRSREQMANAKADTRRSNGEVGRGGEITGAYSTPTGSGNPD
jgi:hypothetical protein